MCAFLVIGRSLPRKLLTRRFVLSFFGNRFLQALLKLHRVVLAGEKIQKRRPKAKNANKEKKKARPNFVGIPLFPGNPRNIPMFLRSPEMFVGLL